MDVISIVTNFTSGLTEGGTKLVKMAYSAHVSTGDAIIVLSSSVAIDVLFCLWHMVLVALEV